MTQQLTHDANPAVALSLVDAMIAGDKRALWSIADDAFESGSLYNLDLSCLVAIHSVLNYSATASRMYTNSDETWRAIFDIVAKSKSVLAKQFVLNADWLGDDVVGFIQHCVMPAISEGSPNISVPKIRGDAAGSPFDEVHIHVAATTFVALAVFQGIARTSSAFEDLADVVETAKWLAEGGSGYRGVDMLTEQEVRAETRADAALSRKIRSQRRAAKANA